MLKIHSIETFGTHEGPGIRLVIFLQGCNIRCVYCHNPDTQNLNSGKVIRTEEIIKLLEKEKPYFKDKGGLTVSGGEPLLQRQNLKHIFREVKKKGFHTTLDTNGTILDHHSKKLLEFTDLVLLDIKHIDPVWHQKVTKVSNEIVLKFAEYLEEIKKPMWLRYVLVPGYTDQEEFLHKWGKHFRKYNSIERVEILPYHTFGAYKYEQLGLKYPLKELVPPSKEMVNHALNIFKQYFKHVYVR
jgi:pyruvate formate lyase activating enzyme